MISVIIPVLDEGRQLKEILDNIASVPGRKEVIVVDGGSRDKTVKIAKGRTRVVFSEKGRAIQMNAGASIAQGDTLLFLHADCRLEKNAIYEIEKTINEGFVGGCFTLYSGDSLKYKLLDTLGKINSAMLGEYFGDHGIFVREDVFEKIGGFREISIMEDVEFTKRLRKAGKTKQLEERIHANPRRFERGGFFRTLVGMFVLRGLYALGVSPNRLANYYKDVR